MQRTMSDQELLKPFYISTIVCNGLIRCTAPGHELDHTREEIQLGLMDMYNHLVLDDVIVGIKYKNQFKGQGIKSTRSFLNEATVVVHVREECIVNIKMFCNGRFQVSGIKTLAEAREGLNIVLDRLCELRGTEKLSVENREGVLYDVTPNGFRDTPFTQSIVNATGKKVGFLDTIRKKIRIGSEEVVRIHDPTQQNPLGAFGGKTYTQCRRNVYSLQGDYLGYYHFTHSERKGRRKDPRKEEEQQERRRITPCQMLVGMTAE